MCTINYKKVFPSRELRLKILKLTEFIPDKLMIQLQYLISTGRPLDLSNPKRYTEKLQWYKLNYRDPLMTKCADKFEVRKYVESKDLNDILIPLYGVYNRAEEIDYDVFPNKFVLKTTNNSHTNIFCENKSDFDVYKANSILNNWLFKRTTKAGREWAYYNINPRIICEAYLEKDENDDLIDYKFYCFNGKASFIKVITNRFHKSGQKIGIFNSEFDQLPYFRDGVQRIDSEFRKPKNYERMIDIAERLSKDFPHVRVDLYNVRGKIYFGEMTFYDASGYEKFSPDMFDFILGDHFTLPEVRKHGSN